MLVLWEMPCPATQSDEYEQILVRPHRLRSRMQVAAALDKSRKGAGWVDGRLSRNALPQFAKTKLMWSKGQPLVQPCRHVRLWHLGLAK